jgi:hypothetical protein
LTQGWNQPGTSGCQIPRLALGRISLEGAENQITGDSSPSPFQAPSRPIPGNLSLILRSPPEMAESIGQETTIVYEFPAGTVELYTTRKCDYEAALKRNQTPLVAEELHPGYRLVYSIDAFRPPAQCLRPPMSDEQRAAKRERGRVLAAAMRA